VLIDYGIARDPGTLSKTTGTVRGTVDYMDPVYFEPDFDSKAMDYGRADQYGFGVMLYQLLTGVLPFRPPAGLSDLAYQQWVIKRRADGPAPALRSSRPEVPPAVEEAVLMMVERRQADRFRDMRAARRALASALEAAPAPPIPAGPSRRSPAQPASRVPPPKEPPSGPGREEAVIELSGVEVVTDPRTGETRYVLRF
jgi:serine/threonine-protein kinase